MKSRVAKFDMRTARQKQDGIVERFNVSMPRPPNMLPFDPFGSLS